MRVECVVRIVNLEIHKEECTFSAGHFTIFSATEREHLHGHNYYVSLAIKVGIEHNGLAFDYRDYKKKITTLCDQLERHFLLPSESPYLTIEDQGEYWIAHYNQKKIPFLKEDVMILPITNVTLEELSHWFLEKLLEDKADLEQHKILSLTVKVYNGPGQSSGATWEKNPA